MNPLRSVPNILLLGFVLSGWLLGSSAGWANGSTTVESRMQAWGASKKLCSQPGFDDFDLSDDFYCLELPVVVGNGASSPTIRFAIHPAEGPADTRLGVLLTFVGGPGEVGLEDAPSYLEGLSDTLRNSFDLVWFNQRGIDPEHEIKCLKAQHDFTTTRRAFPFPIDTKEKFDKMSNAVRKYTECCSKQIKNTALLPYVSTAQSIADVEAFRKRIGEPKLYLYGQSYGTQFGQAFASTYPASTNRIALDGVVEMTLSGIGYFKRQVRAFDKALVGTLSWCKNDPTCKSDFAGKDPLDVYDQLAAELAKGPAKISFPAPIQNPAPPATDLPIPPPPQSFQPRNFYLTDLEMLAYGQVYSPAQRADFLRWLAAAANGDRVPLLRATYDQWPLDPNTEDPKGKASDAGYYAVECLDFAYDKTSDPFFALESDLLKDKVRIASAAFIDLPCAFWPITNPPQPKPSNPTPLSPQPWSNAFQPNLPVLLLNGDLDPATPVEDVREMIGPLGKWGNKIELANAGHVILDMGDPCVVPQADAFFTSRAPLPTTWNCTTAAVAGYLPLARERKDLVHVYDLEISSLPEYRSWDRDNGSKLVIGCTWGGTASFEFQKHDDGSSDENWSLNRCSLLKGHELSAWGKLHHDEAAKTDTLELTAWDTHPKEHRHYTRNGAYDLGSLPVPGDVSWKEDD